MQEPKIYASDITKAIQRRHTDDFFMTEVKDGPTQYGSHLRLDAVAIAKSWAHPCITGYEVKVSRSDWLADQKWNQYVPLCHRFSIAAAPGVVKDGEIPDGIGWYEFISSSGGLRIKQKPAHRDIEVDANMLMYIIMCRIDPDRVPFYKDRAAYVRDYLSAKKEHRYIGNILSRQMQKKLEQAEKTISIYSQRTEEQEAAIKAVDDIKALVRAHGGWARTESLASEIEKLLHGETNNRISRILKNIQTNVDELALLTTGQKQAGGNE